MSISQSTIPHVPSFATLAELLDSRSAPRLALLFLGVLLARGRRTVTSWIRAVGLSQEFRSCYTTISAAGKRAQPIATRLLTRILKPLLVNNDRLVFAIDDTPTPRYGPYVEGAGKHHNPTPGPAGGAFVYGHLWVTLALLLPHTCWGVIALPLLARLYIRKKDLPSIDKKHRPAFRTKLEQAAELMTWAWTWLRYLGKPLWAVVDGAYAKAPFLNAMKQLGITVVSRLRKDAALWTVPQPRRKGQRGRTPIYGDKRISLAKRAGSKGAWTTETFVLYGKATVKRYKTFLATWGPVGGVIRVVLVAEQTGWVAFFCTDESASVKDILGCVADRFSLEIGFRDIKEVVGAGQQQVRHIWANIGAYHMCLWTFTLTEVWAWGRRDEELVSHRSASPWDDEPRRPSHADKRRAWKIELLGEEIRSVLGRRMTKQEIAEAAERLLNLAV